MTRMRVVRVINTNILHIINPTERIIDRIDAWRMNGNRSLEVHFYADLIPRTDGSQPSSILSPPKEIVDLEVREPSGIFGRRKE